MAGARRRTRTFPRNYVSPGFFATAGIPVLAGREFSERDRESTPDVTVVNLAFARRFLPWRKPDRANA